MLIAPRTYGLVPLHFCGCSQHRVLPSVLASCIAHGHSLRCLPMCTTYPSMRLLSFGVDFCVPGSPVGLDSGKPRLGYMLGAYYCRPSQDLDQRVHRDGLAAVRPRSVYKTQTCVHDLADLAPSSGALFQTLETLAMYIFASISGVLLPCSSPLPAPVSHLFGTSSFLITNCVSRAALVHSARREHVTVPSPS